MCQLVRIFCLFAGILVFTLPSVLAQETSSKEEPAAIPDDPAQFHLFILAGQSNMAGRGTVAAEDKQVDGRVWMLDESRQWVPAVDPLHFDKPKAAGVGLGRTFAIDYANAHPGLQVGLIPCAVGGTPITNWRPGSYHDQTKSHPWDDCVARVNDAMPSGVLKGVLWHQGEGDSNAVAARRYEVRLTELIARCRETFAAPDVPFLIGQLGRFDGRTWNEYREQVDETHRRVARSIPHCGFVSSDGLNHGGDHLHFDAESLREFGHRYYQVYAAMNDD